MKEKLNFRVATIMKI